MYSCLDNNLGRFWYYCCFLVIKDLFNLRGVNIIIVINLMYYYLIWLKFDEGFFFYKI